MHRGETRCVFFTGKTGWSADASVPVRRNATAANAVKAALDLRKTHRVAFTVIPFC